MTIWMVERKQGEIWVPESFERTFKLATQAKKELKEFYPESFKFRVRKYSRVEETQ